MQIRAGMVALGPFMAVAVSMAAPLGTGLTYQGQLKQNGQLSNGPVNLVVRLYDAGTGGNLLGTQTLNSVPVSAGVFTLQLNAGGEFGPLAFNGQARWLEIEVNGTKLSPRQVLTVAPYAQHAVRPWATAGQSISYTGGNVGIGTFSPTAKLEIGGTPGVDGIKFPDGSVQVSASTSGSGFWTGLGDDIFNSNSGRVGIGRNDAAFALDVRANSGFGARLGMQGIGGGALVVASNPDDNRVYLEGYNSTDDGSAEELLITGYAGTPLPALSLYADQINLSAGTTNVSGRIQADGGLFGTGVYGQSTDGWGVHGQSTSSAGVIGRSDTAAGVTGVSNNFGVEGYSPSGRGVSGISGSGYGVYGRSDSSVGVWGTSDYIGVAGDCSTGYGVFGRSTSSYGILGESTSDHGIVGGSGHFSGVNTSIFAKAGVWGDSKQGNGVMGTTATGPGAGVVGFAPIGHGVYGYTNDGKAVYGIRVGGGWAGYFDGPLHATSATSSVKAFRIDHPVDPEHKYLQHSSVESPDMMNIYNGNVTTDDRGYATVSLPGYFEALNRDFRYQLTVLDNADSDEFVQVKVVKQIQDNRFTIRTSRANTKVSWQVTGIRQDAYAKAHPIVVEESKPAGEQGKYLTPEVYGRPREAGINYAGSQLAGQGPATQPTSP